MAMACLTIWPVPHSLQQSFLPSKHIGGWRSPNGISMCSNGCMHGSLTNCNMPQPSSAISSPHISSRPSNGPQHRRLNRRPAACGITLGAHPPRAQLKFQDTAPAMEDLRWQLMQATAAAGRKWVLDTMAQHCDIAPRNPSKEPSPPRDEAHEMQTHIVPFLAQTQQELQRAQSWVVWLCLDTVAHVPGRPSP